jgi:peroxidase
MASASNNFLISLVVVVAAAALASGASAQLSSTFYDTSCPNALSTIRTAVNAAVAQEARMGASLLRLHFHDCFVQGCDASVLLNDTNGGEQNAIPNAGSLRGFGVIDNIKAQLEALCPQTVSCADILTVAARDSVVALGGPSWTVPLGRRDSTNSNATGANSDLPPPSFNLDQLINSFGNNNKNFTVIDMVALSGTYGALHALEYFNYSVFFLSISSRCSTFGAWQPGDQTRTLAPFDYLVRIIKTDIY